MRLLLLGGTTEARQLAQALDAGAAGPLEVILSLAGRTSAPSPGPARLRTGGFGGADGLAAYLRNEKIDLLVDATHPFAATISANATAAADGTGIPLLRLVRPAWSARDDERWTTVPDMAGAVAAVQAAARRVFLTVGASGIDRFVGCTGIFFLIRMIEPPAAPPELADCRLVFDRGPFDTAGEMRLMREHRIDTLVTKNSGGAATRPKLDAAQALRLSVVMVDRPREPAERRVEDVPAALDWIVDKWRTTP